MKKKYNYGVLGISILIVNIVFTIGAGIVYYVARYFSNHTNGSDYEMLLKYGSMLFLFSLVATLVLSIMAIVYFVYEERALTIIISGIIGIFEGYLVLRSFNSLVNLFVSGIVAIFINGGDKINEAFKIIASDFGWIVILIWGSLLFNCIIFLAMTKVVCLPFLQPYLPKKYQLIKIKKINDVDEVI